MRDVTTDATGGSPGDTIWLSYAELADRLGIDPASAKRRARRRRWPKRPGNDGTARVAVPAGVLEDAQRRQEDDAGDDPEGVVEDIAEDDAKGIANVLRGELTETKEVLRAVQADLKARIAETIEARERAARAEGEAAGLKTALAELRAEMQAQRDHRARGLWVRLTGRE